MPKAKWISGISSDAIDEVDTSKGYVPYDGPEPPKGVYGFKLSLKKTESSKGNDQIEVRLTLDPRDRLDHKKYAGFFMMDWIPVMESTAWRVRALTDALGVTGKDFVTKTILDEDGGITRIGNVKIESTLIRAHVGKDPSSDQGYYKVFGYLPAADEEMDEEMDADADTDDSQPPF